MLPLEGCNFLWKLHFHLTSLVLFLYVLPLTCVKEMWSNSPMKSCSESLITFDQTHPSIPWWIAWIGKNNSQICYPSNYWETKVTICLLAWKIKQQSPNFSHLALDCMHRIWQAHFMQCPSRNDLRLSWYPQNHSACWLPAFQRTPHVSFLFFPPWSPW